MNFNPVPEDILQLKQELDKYNLNEVSVIYHSEEFKKFREELRPYFLMRMKEHGGFES